MREKNASSSLLADLATALRVRWVVVFSLAWDESWSNPRDAFALGGYVFSPEDSSRFCERWREALRKADLEYFHMTDFLAKEKPPYNHWNERYRMHLFNTFINIIHTRARYQFITLFSLEDMRNLSDEQRSILRSHTEYSVSAMGIVGMVTQVLGESTPISYVYDGVEPRLGLSHVVNEFVDLQNRGKISAESYLSRGNMKTNPELQAADILVHECVGEYERYRRNPYRTPSHWGSKLIRGFPGERQFTKYCDKEWFQREIESIVGKGGVKIIEQRPPFRRRKRRTLNA
jgi:hypothetical protein